MTSHELAKWLLQHPDVPVCYEELYWDITKAELCYELLASTVPCEEVDARGDKGVDLPQIVVLT